LGHKGGNTPNTNKVHSPDKPLEEAGGTEVQPLEEEKKKKTKLAGGQNGGRVPKGLKRFFG